MIEIEHAFVSDLKEVTDVIENILKNVTRTVREKGDEDLVNIAKNSNVQHNFDWLEKPFPTLSYKEAIDILDKNKNRIKSHVNPKDGLSKEQELFLVEYIGGPIFVVNWPREMKPFYMRPCTTDLNMVDAVDLLAPVVGELAGGSVRENDYKRLRDKIPPNMEWYLDLRKYGGITTGGFGIGFERYLQFVLGISNIKDVIPFPRWAHNCSM